MRFEAKKGPLYESTLGILTGLFLYSLFSDKFSWTFSLLILIPIALMAFNYFSTYYIIKNKLLIYRSGLIKGSIPIDEIREVEPDKTLWAGLKPALASKGILIHYNKFDEIYVAPINNAVFISELSKLNPNIKIKSQS